MIAWARSNAAESGAHPSLIVVAGSSAGAHLASMAALTPNDPAFQPSGEHADTAVAAAVCLCGYYGDRDATSEVPSSPQAYIAPDAPPFLVAHGDNDSQISMGQADRFVAQMPSGSNSPVVYFQLPGAQHSFDFFHSLRFDQVVDGIDAFAAWVRANRQDTARRPAPRAGSAGTAPNG